MAGGRRRLGPDPAGSDIPLARSCRSNLSRPARRCSSRSPRCTSGWPRTGSPSCSGGGPGVPTSRIRRGSHRPRWSCCPTAARHRSRSRASSERAATRPSFASMGRVPRSGSRSCERVRRAPRWWSSRPPTVVTWTSSGCSGGARSSPSRRRTPASFGRGWAPPSSTPTSRSRWGLEMPSDKGSPPAPRGCASARRGRPVASLRRGRQERRGSLGRGARRGLGRGARGQIAAGNRRWRAALEP